MSLNPLKRLTIYRALRPLNARSRKDIVEFRDRRIQRVVRHAYENVPLYKRLFDERGVRPSQIKGAADLGRLPVISRTEVQLAKMSDRLARGV